MTPTPEACYLFVDEIKALQKTVNERLSIFQERSHLNGYKEMYESRYQELKWMASTLDEAFKKLED